jgi:hypothetical protein
VLAVDAVKYVGDRVAFVVAEIAAQGWMPWSMQGFGSCRMSQSAFRWSGRGLLETSISGDALSGQL